MLATVSSQPKPGSSLDHFQSKKIETDSIKGLPCIIPSDTIDNPALKRFYLNQDTSEENIFLEMKHEANRLYSFKNRWPVADIKPESLAEAGFFYLQQEDRVQCPFCYVIIYNWTRGDKPLREHMRKSPKCPFLVGSEVGNIPLLPWNKKPTIQNSVSEKIHPLQSVTASFKPKHPSMADIKRRILTYSGWPFNKPAPDELAECGLYYSGIADIVSCFFCGGTLGNWEPNDNPWNEHSKFFPECSFLAISKSKFNRPSRIQSTSEKKLHDELKNPVPNGMPSVDITSDIIKQALEIFPEPLVIDAVKSKSGRISSLQELCDDILELKQPSHLQSSPVTEERNSSPEKECKSAASQDTLLCKLCMDRERGVVFQPCGHLVACWQCSNLISDCPVCRKPISYKIKTYLS